MNPVTEVKTNPNAAPELAVVNGGAAVAEAPQKLAAIAGPEARLGDRRFFADQTFHFEAPRALGYTGGAEAGEVLDTVGHTTKGMSRAGTLHGQRPQTAGLRRQLPLYRILIIMTALVYRPNIQGLSIFGRDDTQRRNPIQPQ